jgi:phage gp16-like protein
MWQHTTQHSNWMMSGKVAEGKFEAVTVKQWQNICSHVEKIEVEYMKREYIVDEVDDLIISINGEESDDSD